MSKVVHVEAPACDDRGWLVRIREQQSGEVSERLHWYEEESAAEAAYRLFMRKLQLSAA